VEALLPCWLMLPCHGRTPAELFFCQRAFLSPPLELFGSTAAGAIATLEVVVSANDVDAWI
jgi:hypothetical protein